MKTTAKVLLAIFFLLPTCKTLPPSVATGTGKVIDCAKDSISEIAKDNISRIQGELLQSNWKDLLTSDALKLGTDVVACLVDYVVMGSKQDALRAATDKNAHTRVERGQQWLDGEKVVFQKRLAP